MVNYLTSVSRAVFLTIRFLIFKEWKPSIWKKYIFKSFNLSLCYCDFSLQQNFKQSIKSGEIGFACSIYDYVTEHLDFNAVEFESYKTLLTKYFCSELINIVDELYSKEHHNCLAKDGLERGSLAFRFVIGHLDAEAEWTNGNDDSLDLIGLKLQVLDDLLDLEEDSKLSHINCFLIDYEKYKKCSVNFIQDIGQYEHFRKKEALMMRKILSISEKKLNRLDLVHPELAGAI